MRQSVEIGLDSVRNVHCPQLSDYWLLIPADHPIVDPRVVQELRNAAEVAFEASSRGRGDSAACGIWIPTWRGRRGHPTLFRWHYVDRIANIPAGHGINWLVKHETERVCTVSVDSPSILWDMDTPEDYAELCARYQKGDV
jgi:molybdenum cofactor cytidylyltransferase